MADNSGNSTLRALVGLEVTRTLPTFGRGLVMGAVVTGVLIVTGVFTLPRLAFILGIVAFTPAAGIPINALRDKIDGGLEFLQLLPASPGIQAMARFLSVALLALPGALIGTAAAALLLAGDVPTVLGVRPLFEIFLALALFFAAIGSLATALVLRFELSQTTWAPLVFLGVVLVGDHYEERYLPDPLGTFTGLMGHAWFLPVLWAVGILGTVLAAWFAFALARAGIARFSPPRDRITW